MILREVESGIVMARSGLQDRVASGGFFAEVGAKMLCLVRGIACHGEVKNSRPGLVRLGLRCASRGYFLSPKSSCQHDWEPRFSDICQGRCELWAMLEFPMNCQEGELTDMAQLKASGYSAESM